jgi:orotate phosphoribosyltransferase
MNHKDELLNDLKKTGALMEGHYVLSSGLHSNCYVQCARLLQHPELAEKHARILAEFFTAGEIEAVAGPALGGVVLAYELARQLNARAFFTERGEDGKMLLRRGFEISPGEKIIIAEDVITTGKSAVEVTDIIKDNGGLVSGVCCLIDRSGGGSMRDVDIRSAVSLEIDSWTPGLCPLCRKGVPAEKPGSRKE